MTVPSTHNMQLGLRQASAETILSAELADSYQGMPEGYGKIRVQKLLERYGRHKGIKPNAIALLNELLEVIPKSAFKHEGVYDPMSYDDRRPLVVFMGNESIASRLNITVRSVSRLLRELHWSQFVSMVDSEDRTRGSRNGVNYGIDVRPALAQIVKFQQDLDDAELNKNHQKQLKRSLTAVYTEMRSMFEAVDQASQLSIAGWANLIREAVQRDQFDDLCQLYEKAILFRDQLKTAVAGLRSELVESCADDSEIAPITYKPVRVDDSVKAVRKDGGVQAPETIGKRRAPWKRPQEKDIVPDKELMEQNLPHLLPHIGVAQDALSVGTDRFMEMHGRQLRSEIRLSPSAGDALRERWGTAGFYAVMLIAAKRPNVNNRAGYARSFLAEDRYFNLLPSFMGILREYIKAPLDKVG